MSNLTEIRQAYERLKQLLDREILDRKGEAAELRRFRRWLDTAFYLLAWANFENLTERRPMLSFRKALAAKVGICTPGYT